MTQIDNAYDVYASFIHDIERIRMLNKYNLKVAGSVPSVIWELFGSVLTSRSGSGNTGADLVGWEVKSAKFGGNFEYQYHLNTGLHKLNEDCVVNHLFCIYSEDYAEVLVLAMRGSDLADEYFNRWRPEYSANYNTGVPSSERRQRFRKNVSQNFVVKNSMKILSIKKSKIVFQDENVINLLNSETE